MDAQGEPRVVLVHDWLTGMRGGEKCLEVLCRRWPRAPLFTLLHGSGSVSPVIERRPLHTSLLQRLPAVGRYYRYLLPVMPAAAASWRLPACDLVLSFSHCVAKAARPPRGVPHVCYCFTPMRYAWHQRQAYFGADRFGRLKSRAIDWLLQHLRAWDRQTAERVTHFLAISRTVQERIAECYQRTSTVIYPPVDTDFFCPARTPREDYYLAVSAFAPYKRLDLAIAACKRMNRRLVIIGGGQDERRLRALAGPSIHFLGWQPDEVIRAHYRRCRALLFPGEEDFGIVPVEAQACGAPVLAFGRGGASETVVPPGSRREPTGLWFEEQSVDCLASAMEMCESGAYDFSPSAARRQALAFNPRRFEEEMMTFLNDVLETPATAASRQAA
ncbi:MAG TPA: glycosyltransferase [Gemmataceae bacterium]|jgi:glycosyltransferase involved in cell wall biosynthesis|nr:glycosyltransferase [Gemmataceae bacterium]